MLLFDIINVSKCNPNNDEINLIIDDMKNYYDILIQNGKSNYYSNMIGRNENASKAMWNVVNKERGKHNSPNLDFTDVVRNVDGIRFSSKKNAVDAMNSRFLSAASACGAPRADVASVCAALQAARPRSDRSLRLLPFTADEVYRIVTERIPPKGSKDIYGLSMKLIRLAIIPLTPVLVELYNLCLREGSFPTPMKISKVSPLYKGKGKRDSIDNYRPVSIIPAVAKIFENGLSKRLTNYLSDTNALSERQYAYREGRSTTAIARQVVRTVVAAREDKKQVAVICCDLSKAFDVADRTVLAAKLQHYGVGGTSYALLTDLMQHRSQVVVGCGGTERSDPLLSAMGVAQGSSVSNILFSLLLNDLPEAVTHAEVFMYADDVAAVVTAPSVDELERRLNDAASQLAEWFKINGLALNLSKTHFVHFCLSGKATMPITVFVNGMRIMQVESTTFLGFQIDRGLKWESHINTVCAKVGSACFALRRVGRVVPAEAVRSCYFATVHSLLQYGAELWGRAADWERAFRVQKRAVRAIARIRQDESAKPHFQKLGILTLPSIVIYQVAIYVWLNKDEYKRHSQFTRNRHRLVAVTRKLEKSNKLTHVMGPTVYNKIPGDITAAPNLNRFKTLLKRWLVQKAFYSYDEYINFKNNVK